MEFKNVLIDDSEGKYNYAFSELMPVRLTIDFDHCRCLGVVSNVSVNDGKLYADIKVNTNVVGNRNFDISKHTPSIGYSMLTDRLYKIYEISFINHKSYKPEENIKLKLF